MDTSNQTPNPSTENTNNVTAQRFLSKGWKWFAIVGALIALAGLAAISLPVAAGLTITTIIGGIFLFSGLVQAYHTFSIHEWKVKLWYVLSAVLYIVGGLFILFKPLEGLVTITMLMVIVMIFNGATRMIFGMSNRGLPGSTWIILSGLLSVIIGGYFFSYLDDPTFSLSLLGIFVGVSLLIEGISFIFLGLQMKKLVN
ncbi:HdeD family acid-resistance protein [Photobacterium aphoticum]|uniref:Membrane protein n=1 Tax=Photobacterium aphoticum TaxID=754436 RepID=A0A0J1GPU8_9GAMM|nr:DUF308 domain-containing protein [Photobacterium aphoticum]KLV01775.1 membrane protein [Photobacterium aphoticum]PSU58740.1 hypothetical protein C9I90_05840 [Photobacterium aphoticum]GHA32349.1 membrane protein [Photobacterium aphoticum]